MAVLELIKNRCRFGAEQKAGGWCFLLIYMPLAAFRISSQAHTGLNATKNGTVGAAVQIWCDRASVCLKRVFANVLRSQTTVSRSGFLASVTSFD